MRSRPERDQHRHAAAVVGVGGFAELGAEEALFDAALQPEAEGDQRRADQAQRQADLERQGIQGTGPATKPRASMESGLRNAAYALLAGADGWMFDGEDALGQVDTMSLDNQRNLRLAIARDPLFLRVAEEVAAR